MKANKNLKIDLGLIKRILFKKNKKNKKIKTCKHIAKQQILRKKWSQNKTTGALFFTQWVLLLTTCMYILTFTLRNI